MTGGIQLTNDGERAVVGRLLPWLRILTVHLQAAPIVLTKALVYASFTEPTFDGYAPLPFGVWSGNFLDALGNGAVQGSPLKWTVGPMGGSDMIYGVWVVDPNGYAVYAELDPSGPQAMNVPGQTFSYLPYFSAGNLC